MAIELEQSSRRRTSWAPAALMVQVQTLQRNAFLDDFGDTDFLLVRVERTDDSVARGLAACAYSMKRSSPGVLAPPDPHTIDVLPSAEAIFGAHVPGLLVDEPHFVVPIRKRFDTCTADDLDVRIGRGHGNDIVLRDKSVSKLHAVIHLDQVGALSLSDMASHNHTFVNDEVVQGRVLIAPGDRLRFGRLGTVLASASQLWSMLHS